MFKSLLATLLCCSPLLAGAACMEQDPARLWNYQGTIAQQYRIGLTLVFGPDALRGEYFYLSQRKDIALRGMLGPAQALTLEELDAAGAVQARIEGKFDADCSRFDGTWRKTGAAEALPLQLTLSNGSSGELGHRYGVAGDASDAVVHANAEKFWLAVQKNDAKAVVAALAYPVRAQVRGRKTVLRNAKQALSNYDAIFNAPFRAAILAATPHNMSASWRGIMLGEHGEVWLNDKGQPVSLNN